MTTTAETIRAHVAELQDRFSTLEAKIMSLKAKRDAHIAKHRPVYDTERKLAADIQTFQEEAMPIAMELKALRAALRG